MACPTTARARCSLRAVLAPLVAVGVIGALPAPARAECATRGCDAMEVVAVTSAGLGAATNLVVLAGLGLGGASRIEPGNRDQQTFFYVTGGISLGLGALGVGLQAGARDPCPFKSTCQVSYGLGATAMALGALWIGVAIYLGSAPPRSTRRAWVTPVPLVIPTEHGPTAGVGLSGVTF
jgi:hypothetical protein